MSKLRICEVCEKEYNSNLVLKCPECFKEHCNKRQEVKNLTERVFKDLASANGWEVTKKGYPDFICYRENRIVLVEVKSGKQKPMKEQERFMKSMIKLGIECIVWRPSDGFIKP